MIYERHSEWQSSGRLYRASRDAMIFGVCAGIADRYGFDRTMTRVVTLIAGLIFFPTVMIGYVILALLLKKAPSDRIGKARPRYRERPRPDSRATYERQRQHMRDLDDRLRKLEEYVTSRRYKLDREFEKLRD